MNQFLMLAQDFPQTLMETMAFSKDNILVFVLMVTNISMGFITYTNVASIQKRDHTDCYPMNFHACMIVWDSLCAITMTYCAIKYNFFWLFSLNAVLHYIWVFGEFMSIKAHIQTDRQEDFGPLVGNRPVTRKMAYGYTALMIGAWAVLWYSVSWMLGGLGNCAIWITMPWTNFVMPCIAWSWFEKRRGTYGTSLGNSTFVQLIFILQCFLMTFKPTSWPIRMVPFLDHPVYYAVGSIATVMCAITFYKTRKLPLPTEPKAPEFPVSVA